MADEVTKPGFRAGLPTAHPGRDDLAPGTWVGTFAIERRVGRGGCATVYRARDLERDRVVAIKVLHQELVAGPSMVRRFELEAETVRRIGHPAIVEVLGLGALPDGRPYFVMEWLEGRDLEEELRTRRRLSPPEVLEVVEALGPPLSRAHALGVVHRDLKLSNVFVQQAEERDRPRYRLLDFGIAKVLDPERPEDRALTRTGVRLGTPSYMAPEQLRGQAVDGRTDVYSLGVMLFELLTGQLPFRAGSHVEIEELHLRAPPPDPADIAPIPRPLGGVILRCLAKAAQARFPDVESLLEALRRAVDDGRAHHSDAAPAVLRARLELRLDDDPGTLSDEELDTLERRVDTLATWCQDRGLQIVARMPTAVLAMADLPAEPTRARALRADLVTAALALTDQVRGDSPGRFAAALQVTSNERQEWDLAPRSGLSVRQEVIDETHLADRFEPLGASRWLAARRG